MTRIDITPYNYIIVWSRDETSILFSWQDGRKYRARIRHDEHGREYFCTRDLMIPIERRD
jgi:hypothetical protein